MNLEQAYYRANISIKSKTISALEITETLKTQPTKSYEKGTPISSRNPLSKIREESVWILDSKVLEEKDLNIHIEQLICFVEERIGEFNKLKNTCNIEIFCGFFSDGKNGEVSLSPSLIKRLTIIPIDLVINLYLLNSNDKD